MLTTVIYRSHICDSFSYASLVEMVVAANAENTQSDVSGILLYNGKHFFQLLEGPEEQVMRIFRHISEDKRHTNVVELLCDYAPARRFGKVGMELFDLREYDKQVVLQAVLDQGTTRYQLAWNDRALNFFRTFIESTEKENYFELPPVDSWIFVPDGNEKKPSSPVLDDTENGRFAFQPIVDPLALEVVSVEALMRPPSGVAPDAWLNNLSEDARYHADLKSKSMAFSFAGKLGIGSQTLSVNLLPMTLVHVPHAVDTLLHDIVANGLLPEQVIVEFTESEVFERIDEFTSAVRQLKAAGISVAIDHFGAGFAGLSLLAQFQPDRIKINRSLIQDVHKSGPRQAIIHAIIKCCASLEIAVTAVGVEKAEEWMWLESAGVCHFQGHLFAAPLDGGIPGVSWPERRVEIEMYSLK